jgi:hypothetical protein
MLKINSDQQVLPLGGHQFACHGTTFTDETFPGLIEKVVDFRITNLLLMGDPEQEILQYYLEKWPNMVRADYSEVEPPTDSNFQQWARWVGRTWRVPPKATVTIKEATDRMATCKGCPHNKPFDWAKTAESAALSQRTFLLRKGYDFNSRHGFCDLHKVDISVFCFLATPDAFSEIESQEEPQASCWVGSLEGS